MRSLYSAMRSLTDSMAVSNGCSAVCSSGLKLLASPRAVLTSPVRVRTRPARARIIIRSACARALRCFTGLSNSGSIRASRASVCASSRSSFLRLSPISRTLRAFATITSCPNSLSKRLIQGECVPISSAIRLRSIAPKTSRNAFALVETRCSRCIWPASSTAQYQLLRSPRSNPMVSFCCEIFLLCIITAVLTFFIAGLLFICALSTSITWERTPHPVRRPAFSSHLIASVDILRRLRLLPNCSRVGIPHTAQPNGENHTPNYQQDEAEDAGLGTKTAAGKQWVTVKAGTEQMAVGPVTAVHYVDEVKLAPVPCRVDSQWHPQVPRSAQNQNRYQAIHGRSHRPQSMAAGIEVVYPAHKQRCDDRRRPEADPCGQGELQISAIEKVLKQRAQES